MEGERIFPKRICPKFTFSKRGYFGVLANQNILNARYCILGLHTSLHSEAREALKEIIDSLDMD